MKFSIYIIFALISIVNCAYSGSPPPPFSNCAINVKTTLNENPLNYFRIGEFEAKFGSTTLHEIKTHIGRGKIEHSGEAATSQYWIYYSIPTGEIWFISHGEMGGSSHALTGVEVILSSSNSKDSSSSNIFNSFQFQFGFLGSTKKSVIAKLGSPSGIKDRSIIYFYENQNETWTEFSNVEITFENNKIISIDAHHVISN